MFRAFVPSAFRTSLGLVKKHPKVSGAVVSLSIVNWWLRYRASVGLYEPVLRELETGSRPIVSVPLMVHREDLIVSLKDLCLTTDTTSE